MTRQVTNHPQSSRPAQIDLLLLPISLERTDELRLFSSRNQKTKRRQCEPSVGVDGPYASTNAQADRKGSQPVLSFCVSPAPGPRCAHRKLHSDGHVTKHRSSPLHRSSQPGYLPIARWLDCTCQFCLLVPPTAVQPLRTNRVGR